MGLPRHLRRVDRGHACHLNGRVMMKILPALVFPEAVMLHSLQPKHFSNDLRTPRRCPECKRRFRYGNGIVFLAHYRELMTGETRQGLMCFCSTACLLHWEPCTMLGLMQ